MLNDKNQLPDNPGRSTTGRERPRRLPGFRTAVLAFCLIALMGAGSGYAIALWSQSADLTMQVKAETMPPPKMSCVQGPDDQSVEVSWIPQRVNVTSYRVTVTKNGSPVRDNTYDANTTTETIEIPTGLPDAYSDTYAVTVVAHYGTWQAQPAAYDTIKAVKPSSLGSASISCA